MRRIKLVFIMVLLILIAIITLQNTESVETQLLFYTIRMPRAMLLLLTACLGFIVGLFAAVRMGRGR